MSKVSTGRTEQVTTYQREDDMEVRLRKDTLVEGYQPIILKRSRLDVGTRTKVVK